MPVRAQSRPATASSGGNGEKHADLQLPVSPYHLQHLRASGLTDETILQNGICTEDSRLILARLLKRPDELFVVEHAHLQPRFVEDSVRHALRDALTTLPQLDDGDFLLSRQVNFETIHIHDVVAERYGTVGELRGELESGTPSPHQTTLTGWLSAA